MFFYLSKVLWFVMDPGNILFILIAVGTILLFSRWVRLGKFFCMAAFIYYGVVGILPAGTYFLDILEQRFSKPAQMPDTVDGIIVLGGVVDIANTIKKNDLVLAKTRERVEVLPELTKRYPAAKVLFSSGSGTLGEPQISEAELIRPYFERFVLNMDNVVFETKSRNTYENVIFSKELIKPSPGEKWLLVTSASHMPRSVGVFRAQGWNVIPYPVNYIVGDRYTYKLETELKKGLIRLRAPLHEWLGLLAYYVTRKTSEFFPSPN